MNLLILSREWEASKREKSAYFSMLWCMRIFDQITIAEGDPNSVLHSI